MIRSAMITLGANDGKFGMKTLCRPLKLLVTLEVNPETLSNIVQNPPPQSHSQQHQQQQQQSQSQQSVQSHLVSRPRRRAVVLGEMLRRTVMH